MKRSTLSLKFSGVLTVLSLILTIFSLTNLVASAGAATYYVSPNGSDSNNGGSTTPFRTIQKAVNIVQAGDTVLVESGTYSEFSITLKNGTPSAWITFKAYPGDTVIIDAYTDKYARTIRGIDLNGSSYIEISGFKITDSNPLADSSSYAYYSQTDAHGGIYAGKTSSGVQSHHIKITGNEIYHVGGNGIYTGYESYNFEITGNNIYKTALSKRGYGIYLAGDYHVVRGNTIHDAYGYGIHVYSEGGPTPDYNTIEKNVCYNNGHKDYAAGYSGFPTSGVRRGDGIIIDGGGVGNVVRDNLLFGNLNYGMQVRNSNTTVFNNTTYNNGYRGIYVNSSISAVVRNNIAYGSRNEDGSSGNAYIGSGNTQDHNLLSSNPLFVNASGGDFHLQSSSPAVNAGVNVGLTTDMDGNPIVGAPDIGSYEYKGTTADTTAPSIPSSVAATVISSSQINLSWKASTDNIGVAGYKVYRNGTLASVTTTTSFSDTALSPSTTYSYTVAAYDAAGNTSAQSASVSAKTLASADATAPSVPAGLAATAASSSQINLSWKASTDNVGIAGYKIYRSGSQIATTTTTSYSNGGLAASTTYSYTVAAYDAAGNTSAQSAPVSATTQAATTVSVIIDNGSAGTSCSGLWPISGASGAYGANSLWAYKSTSGSTAPAYTWSATLPKSGTYDVYVWWTSYTGSTTRSTAAPYTVTYNGGSQTIKVNQQLNGGKWNKLGTFTFGTSGKVTLTASDVYPVVDSADAVKFVTVQ